MGLAELRRQCDSSLYERLALSRDKEQVARQAKEGLIVSEIADIQIDDGVSFIIKDVETIIDEMEYPGIRFHLDAIFEKMITPIKIDVSTGDVIIPRAIEYNYKLMLEERKIELWSYKLESIPWENCTGHILKPLPCKSCKEALRRHGNYVC